MTRDEAIEIELKHLKKMGMDPVSKRDLAEANIDALIELGLLKVDEPVKIKDPAYVISKMHAEKAGEVGLMFGDHVIAELKKHGFNLVKYV